MTETPRSEADAVAELAPRTAVLPVSNDNLELVLVTEPPGWSRELLNLESFGPAPHRSRGTPEVIDANSFVAELRRRGHLEQAAIVYSDERRGKLVGILNDDAVGISGWRDYRVEYALSPTPEWKHWREGSGKDFGLEDFARHIEDGLDEIVSPSAADMLELAQTFHAQTDATFKQANRLATGASTIVYEENVSATAGAAGQLEIPAELSLSIAPFYGSQEVPVTAWFRYRLRSGHLVVGYKLQKPQDIERDAFAAIVGKVRELDPALVIVNGPAPEKA